MDTNNRFYDKMHTYEIRKKIGISIKSIIRTINLKLLN